MERLESSMSFAHPDPTCIHPQKYSIGVPIPDDAIWTGYSYLLDYQVPWWMVVDCLTALLGPRRMDRLLYFSFSSLDVISPFPSTHALITSFVALLLLFLAPSRCCSLLPDIPWALPAANQLSLVPIRLSSFTAHGKGHRTGRNPRARHTFGAVWLVSYKTLAARLPLLVINSSPFIITHPHCNARDKYVHHRGRPRDATQQ